MLYFFTHQHHFFLNINFFQIQNQWIYIIVTKISFIRKNETGFSKNKNFRQFVICEQHVTIICYYHQFTWYISRTTCTQLHVYSIISIDSRPRVLCVRNRLDCQNFLPFFKHHRVFFLYAIRFKHSSFFFYIQIDSSFTYLCVSSM